VRYAWQPADVCMFAAATGGVHPLSASDLQPPFVINTL
jgi:hypothetical protein